MYKNEYLEKCLEKKRGNGYLLRGYIHTQNKEYDEFVINDLGFMYNKPEELEEFKSELINANIKEFVLTESSSALMSEIHAFDKIGIRITGIAKVKYINKWHKKECFIEGLRMIVQ